MTFWVPKDVLFYPQYASNEIISHKDDDKNMSAVTGNHIMPSSYRCLQLPPQRD